MRLVISDKEAKNQALKDIASEYKGKGYVTYCNMSPNAFCTTILTKPEIIPSYQFEKLN